MGTAEQQSAAGVEHRPVAGKPVVAAVPGNGAVEPVAGMVEPDRDVAAARPVGRFAIGRQCALRHQVGGEAAGDHRYQRPAWCDLPGQMQRVDTQPLLLVVGRQQCVIARVERVGGVEHIGPSPDDLLAPGTQPPIAGVGFQIGFAHPAVGAIGGTAVAAAGAGAGRQPQVVGQRLLPVQRAGGAGQRMRVVEVAVGTPQPGAAIAIRNGDDRRRHRRLGPG